LKEKNSNLIFMLSKPTQKYLQKMADFSLPERKEETLPKIHVDYVASKFATLYEKVRQVTGIFFIRKIYFFRAFFISSIFISGILSLGKYPPRINS
jgi:hypothetical protein